MTTGPCVQLASTCTLSAPGTSWTPLKKTAVPRSISSGEVEILIKGTVDVAPIVPADPIKTTKIDHTKNLFIVVTSPHCSIPDNDIFILFKSACTDTYNTSFHWLEFRSGSSSAVSPPSIPTWPGTILMSGFLWRTSGVHQSNQNWKWVMEW